MLFLSVPSLRSLDFFLAGARCLVYTLVEDRGMKDDEEEFVLDGGIADGFVSPAVQPKSSSARYRSYFVGGISVEELTFLDTSFSEARSRSEKSSISSSLVSSSSEKVSMSSPINGSWVFFLSFLFIKLLL